MTDVNQLQLAHGKQPENRCDLFKVTQPVTVTARSTNSFPDPSLVYLHVEERDGVVWLPTVGKENRESKQWVVLLEIKNHVIKDRSLSLRNWTLICGINKNIWPRYCRPGE